MTNELLLMPRYSVSHEGYPDMPFNGGEIITLNNRDIKQGRNYWLSPYGNYWYEPFFDRFPSIFRKLPWWQDRREDMMPPYIVDTNGRIVKVEWNKNLFGDYRWKVVGGSGYAFGKASESIPATNAQIADFLSK